MTPSLYTFYIACHEDAESGARGIHGGEYAGRPDGLAAENRSSFTQERTSPPVTPSAALSAFYIACGLAQLEAFLAEEAQ
jgi:hypothetical protein